MINEDLVRLTHYISVDDEIENPGFCKRFYGMLTSCCIRKARLKPPRQDTWAYAIYNDLLEVNQDYGYLWAEASLKFFMQIEAPEYLRPSHTRQKLVQAIKTNAVEETSKHYTREIRISQEYGGRHTDEHHFDESSKQPRNFHLPDQVMRHIPHIDDDRDELTSHHNHDPLQGPPTIRLRRNSWAAHFLPNGAEFKDYTQLVEKPSANKLMSGWILLDNIQQPELSPEIEKSDKKTDKAEFPSCPSDQKLLRRVSNMTGTDMSQSQPRGNSESSMIMMNSQFVADTENMEMFDIYVFLNRAIMRASLEQYANQSTMKSIMKLDHSKVVEELSMSTSFFSQWLDCCINMTIREFDRDCKADDTDKELMLNLTKMFNSIKTFSSAISKALYSLLNVGLNGIDMGLAPADTYVIPIFNVIFNKKTFNKRSLSRSVVIHSIVTKQFPLKEMYTQALLRDNFELRKKFRAHADSLQNDITPLLQLDESSVSAAQNVINGKVCYEFVSLIKPLKCSSLKETQHPTFLENLKKNHNQKRTPYAAVIDHLTKIKTCNSPFEKAVHILNSVSQISNDITEFYTNHGVDMRVALTAEELFPIALYLLKTLNDDSIIVDLFICDTFLPYDLKMGNVGYYCNMYITAYHCIANPPSNN